jgi:hypothetical protein
MIVESIRCQGFMGHGSTVRSPNANITRGLPMRRASLSFERGGVCHALTDRRAVATPILRVDMKRADLLPDPPEEQMKGG